jgi:hypothetical protein
MQLLYARCRRLSAGRKPSKVYDCEVLAKEGIMVGLMRDLRWAFRMLWKDAGITTIIVLTAVGTVSGLGLAFGFTPLLSSLLYGVSSHNPLIFTGIPILLIVVALSACLLPTHRAAKANPTALWNP